METRHPSFWHYGIVYVALMGLAVLSFGLSFLPIGGWQDAIAILIGALKALLVAAYFMHLVEQRFANRLVPSVAVALAVILVVITTLDPITRKTFPRAPMPLEASAPVGP